MRHFANFKFLKEQNGTSTSCTSFVSCATMWANSLVMEWIITISTTVSGTNMNEIIAQNPQRKNYEKWITQIYQCCQRKEQIKNCQRGYYCK